MKFYYLILMSLGIICFSCKQPRKEKQESFINKAMKNPEFLYKSIDTVLNGNPMQLGWVNEDTFAICYTIAGNIVEKKFYNPYRNFQEDKKGNLLFYPYQKKSKFIALDDSSFLFSLTQNINGRAEIWGACIKNCSSIEIFDESRWFESEQLYHQFTNTSLTGNFTNSMYFGEEKILAIYHPISIIDDINSTEGDKEVRFYEIEDCNFKETKRRFIFLPNMRSSIWNQQFFLKKDSMEFFLYEFAYKSIWR